MSQNALAQQGLGRAIAPYPNAVNLLPHALPTNYMVPGYNNLGASANSGNGPSFWVYAVAFLAGAVIGGAVCLKCKPFYDAFQRAREDF